ncbi:HAD hydrolase-like protein [Phenylobacterium aquaticum]|uniref:HAD hydrolase-like protein n=1 Tax=Phenylobacterium aquaticum TaxID=1763816 RepID=UPI0026E93B24|nr:HAD hydrolase-like protein [Phenylobacterium aquaticum]
MTAALLLDLDGTLLDSAPGILACARAAVTAMGVTCPPDEDMRWMIGPPLRPSFTRLLGGPDRVEDCIALYRTLYAVEGVAAARPFDGIAAALEALATLGPLYVCTSKMTAFARDMIDRHGLTALFAGVHGADPAGALDDKATLMAWMIGDYGLTPDRCVMIGDRAEDVRAGAGHGMSTVGVLWGYGDAAELADATTLCAAPQDLAATVKAVLSAG